MLEPGVPVPVEQAPDDREDIPATPAAAAVATLHDAPPEPGAVPPAALPIATRRKRGVVQRSPFYPR